MISRDNAREGARNTDDPVLWTLYRSLRNEVNRTVNKDRKQYYDNIYKHHYDKKDVGALYRTAKNQVGWSKNSSPTCFMQEGKKITDPQQMADVQMSTFAEKTKKLLSDIPPSSLDPCAKLSSSLDKWGTKKDERELFKLKLLTTWTL